MATFSRFLLRITANLVDKICYYASRMNEPFLNDSKKWWFLILFKCIFVNLLHNVVRSLLSARGPNELQHNKTNATYMPNKDSDQPGHPPSLIRDFTVRMKKPWVLCFPLSEQRRLIGLADAQADLSLHWAHRSFCWFWHGATQMFSYAGFRAPSISYGRGHCDSQCHEISADNFSRNGERKQKTCQG